MKLEVNLNDLYDVEQAHKLLTGLLDHGSGGAKEAQADAFISALPNFVAEINTVAESLTRAEQVAVPAAPIPTPAEVFAATAIITGDGSSVALPPVIDSEGLPWDARIHATTKTKTQDGKWKKGRGMETYYVDAVMKELRLARDGQKSLPLGVPPAPAPQGDRPSFSVAAYAEGLVPKVTMEQCVTALADTDAPTTFEQLMPRLTAAVTGGTLQASAISAACLAHGLPSIVALQARPDLVAAVWADLGMP